MINKLSVPLFPDYEVYEQEPGFRIVPFTEGNYYLFLPWMVYILKTSTDHPLLRVGFRTKPLNINNLNKEILLFPPLPNIFYDSLLVCCNPPTISEFWQSDFENGEDYGDWVGTILLHNTDLRSYEHWSTLKPKEVMAIFEQWPFTTTFMKQPTYRTQIPFGELQWHR